MTQDESDLFAEKSWSVVYEMVELGMADKSTLHAVHDWLDGARALGYPGIK